MTDRKSFPARLAANDAKVVNVFIAPDFASLIAPLFGFSPPSARMTGNHAIGDVGRSKEKRRGAGSQVTRYRRILCFDF
jgi:hypothetical protein